MACTYGVGSRCLYGVVAAAMLLFGGGWSGWIEDQELIPAEAAPYDEYGWAVALSEDTAILGGPRAATSVLHSGAAVVFTLTDGVWAQTQMLAPTDADTGPHFGNAISISGDTAVIGALRDDDFGQLSGAAYVFVRTDEGWIVQQKLVAADGAANDEFGRAVSISGDTILIGASGHDVDGVSTGAAYVYVRIDGVWTEEQQFAATDADQSDHFGSSVALDADTALVSAPFEDAAASSSGSAYVFVREDGVWTQQQKLSASDGAEQDYFGGSVSLAGDTALVGAWLHEHSDLHAQSGAAYVYVRSDGVWTEQQELLASDTAAYDGFGRSVSLADDLAVVGSTGADGVVENSGAAYVFSRVDGAWTEEQTLMASEGAEGDRFGVAVCLSGSTVLVGADQVDHDSPNIGSAYLFTRPCGNGRIDPSEDCDDAGETATCDEDCTAAVCGDGHVNPAAGEECDDGNVDNEDGCASDCTEESLGTTSTGETSDGGEETGNGDEAGGGTTGDGEPPAPQTTTTEAPDTATDTDPTSSAANPDNGCSCSTGHGGAVWTAPLLLLFAGIRRGRR